MKLMLVGIFIGNTVYASDDIDVKIDWVQNVSKSTVLEVCGSATSKSGKWPLIVSISHGESVFSTMTSKNNRYCQLVARQSWNGKVTVEAASLDRSDSIKTEIELK